MAKGAVDEQDRGDIRAGKFAICELAVLIFSFFQGGFPEVFFFDDKVCEEGMGHHILNSLGLTVA
jgi:hypothetical protein